MSTEAELSVLSSMIMKNEAVCVVAEKLTTEMFTNQYNRNIFDKMVELDLKSIPIDEVQLKSMEIPIEYLTQVLDREPHGESAEYHADIVLESHRKAEVTRLASDLTLIASSSTTADTMITEAEKAFRNRTELETQDSSRVMHVREVEVSFETDDIKYLKTQFPELNAQIMGFGSTALIGVLGATGMGKTSLMIDFLLHFGFTNEIPCAMFSCELTNIENMQRMCCNLSDKNLVSIVNGFCSKDEKDALYQKAAQINMKPIFLNKTPGLTPSDLRRKLTFLHRKEGIQIAFVDHLHNMETDKEHGSRRLNLAYIIRSIKNIAVELEIPIVLGIQTNRNPSNEKRHAELYDAEECGSIEQNLDRCLSPYRPSEYGQPGPDEIYELKGRNCGTGPVTVEFIEAYSSFRNTTRNEF